MRTFSFHSHKSGSGRTMIMINVGETLCIQGCNVLMIDLDFSASGLPVFSSTQQPSPIFSPENLYRLDIHDKANLQYRQFIDSDQKLDDQFEIKLPGLISCFNNENDNALSETLKNNQNLGRYFKNLPVYETRSCHQHPMEGRMFMVPLGGYFKYNKMDKHLSKLTNWTYIPPSCKNKNIENFKILQTIIKAFDEVIFNHDSISRPSFVSELITSAKHIVSKICDVNIDYVLIDQRSGQSGAGCTIDKSIDGMILVGTPTKGNLAGLLNFVDSSGSRKNNSDKDKDFVYDENLPPVVGLILTNIPERPGIDKGLLDYAQVIETNLVHTGWNDLLGFVHHSRNQSFMYIPHKKLDYYFSANDANYHIEKNLSQKNDTNKYNPTIRDFWQIIGNVSDENKDYYKDAFLLAKYDPDLRIYDQTLKNREFIWNFSNVELCFESAISIIASHLREVSVGKHEDAVIHARKKWLKNSIPSVDNSVTNPFVFYYRAVAASNKNHYEDAVKGFNEYDKWLNKRIERLPQTFQHDWPGDWRSSYQIAKVLLKTNLNNSDEIINTFIDALNRIDWLDNKSNQYNWPFKENFIADRKLEILFEFAKFQKEHKKYDKAIDIIEKIYKLDISLRIVEVIELNFQCAQSLILNGKKNQGIKALSDLWNKHIDEKIRNPRLRDDLAYQYIRTVMEWYWADKSNDKDVLLKVLKKCSEWETAEKNKKIQVTDKDRAKASFYFGGAIIENLLNGDETELGKREGIVKALKHFEAAVLRREDWPIAHFALAIGRSLQWKSFQNISKDIQQSATEITSENKDETSTIEFEVHDARMLEQDTRNRDAFYAYEQTFAFYTEVIEGFFESQDATELADSIVEALLDLSNRFKLKDGYRNAFDKWLRELGHPSKKKEKEVKERIDKILTKIANKEIS